MYRELHTCFSFIGWVILVLLDLVLFGAGHPGWGIVVLLLLVSTPMSRILLTLSERLR